MRLGMAGALVPKGAAHVTGFDGAARRRGPEAIASHHAGYLAGRAPRNKGMQYPPDPPGPEEIIVVMRQLATADTACGCGR